MSKKIGRLRFQDYDNESELKMQTKIMIASAGVVLSLLPLTATAAPAKMAPVKKMAAAVTYECTKCHMKVSATTAKKDHYKDAMDGGTLVPVKTAKK